MNPFASLNDRISHQNQNISSPDKKRKHDEIADVIEISSSQEQQHEQNLKKVCFNKEDLTINSNKATFIWLESDPTLFGSKEYIFNPEYTNQVYKDEEEIYGYRDLRIDIHTTSGGLHSYLDANYSYKSSDADDFRAKLNELYLGGWIDTKEKFMEKLADEKNFKPFGKKVYEYQARDTKNQFEIYHSTFDTPGFKEYNKRLQVFLIFLIDGAIFLDDSEKYWDFFITYMVNPHGGYTLVGYASVYNFYQRTDKKRIRISQFFILPPFQRKQHGTALLCYVFEKSIKDPNCFEITVEESGEEFQNLRDLCSVINCIEKGFFDWVKKYREKGISMQDYKKLKLTANMISTIQKKVKLTKLQIQRVFELLKLAVISNEDEDILHKFRDDVKARLYLLNKIEFLPFYNKKIPYLEIDGKLLLSEKLWV